MIKRYIIRKTRDITRLNVYFRGNSEIPLEELRKYFRKKEPEIPDATIQWRIHELVKSSILRRTGRGLYELGPGIEYKPQPPSRVIKISKFIKKHFPTVSFCVWSSGLLNEFAQHISAYPFILLDIERDVSESVYYQIKEHFNGVFLRPTETLINDLLPDFKLPIVIRHLATESPVNEINNVPTPSIEKLLVDVFCDIEFNFLAGTERRAIYNNAYEKYTINENKLLRYAARKGRRQDINKYIIEGDFNKQQNKPI